MENSFENALAELRNAYSVDEDVILDISEKYNLSLIETDKLYSAAADRISVLKAGYCVFNQEKPCDSECRYYSSCEMVSGNMDADESDFISGILRSHDYRFLYRSMKTSLYANKNGIFIYVKNENRQKVVIHPNLDKRLVEMNLDKRIVLSDEMDEFPEQESGYAGFLYKGLLIKLKDEKEFNELLNQINDVKIEIVEKKRRKVLHTDKEKKKVVRRKESSSQRLKSYYQKTLSGSKLNNSQATSYDFEAESDLIALGKTDADKASRMGTDEAKNISDVLMRFGLVYIGTEQHCNHYIIEAPYKDIYYLSKEKLLVFHQSDEDLLKSAGLNYKMVTNYYLKEFPAQVTGYGDVVHIGIGVYVSDEKQAGNIICQIFGIKSVDQVQGCRLVSRKSDEQDNNVTNRYYEDNVSGAFESDKIITDISSREVMLEEYKKWLKKEGFVDRMIEKHENVILDTLDFDLLAISSFNRLIKRRDEYLRDNKVPVLVSAVLRYYTKFFNEKAKRVSNQYNTANTNLVYSTKYRDKYFEVFLKYMREKTDRERTAIGKKPYSYASLKTMAIDVFYLEKNSEKDYSSWLSSDEMLEEARIELVRMLTGKRANPERDARYYVDRMREFKEYLESLE